MHRKSLLFPTRPSCLRAKHIRRRIPRRHIKPARQRQLIVDPSCQTGRVPCHSRKNRLRHLLRERRVPIYPPQRRAIHEPQMPAHDLRKRFLRATPPISPQQLNIIVDHDSFS